MFRFFHETWILGWLGFVVSLVSLIVTIRRGKLEREKLKIEIHKLRNDPAVVSDRRVIYERLRAVLYRITCDLNPTLGEIQELQAICHDASFRFDDKIIHGLKVLVGQVAKLRVDRGIMDVKRGKVPVDDWHEIVERNHETSIAVVYYQERLAETFKQYLSL